jgi:hypothetical protein
MARDGRMPTIESARMWFRGKLSLERKRRLNLIKQGETDLTRWSKAESFRENWDTRAPFAAALCADSKVVCDIGCGKQTLRKLLPLHIVYRPADLVQRTDDTAVCDFNKNQLPESYLIEADTVTLLGVLEYVYDVPWVLNSVREYIETLIVSYNPSDMIFHNRRERGWVNDYKLDEFVQMLVACGYIVRHLSLVDSAQVIIKASARIE